MPLNIKILKHLINSILNLYDQNKENANSKVIYIKYLFYIRSVLY